MNNIVINKYVLNDAHGECFDVIYGSDENYQLGVGVSVISLLINNPNVAFRFHLFFDAINPNFIEKLKWIAESFSTKIIVYELNNDLLKKLPASDVWSSAMYFRLVAFDYLSVHYNYALYLDADVMCHSRLNLTSVLISQVVCGVIVDDLAVRTKSGERLHLPELSQTYFNSGVMYVNLKKWQQNEITKHCFELLSQPNAKQLYKYPDQDVLNLILVDKQVQLNPRFNTIYTLKNELYDKNHNKYKKIITDDTALIHYTGVTKPWHTWANYPSANAFYTALKYSPWSLSDLKPATKFIERKKEYKHLLKQGKFIKGCFSGIRYFFMKFFGVKR